FRPLGMRNTRFLEPPRENRHRAIGYEWQSNTYRRSVYFSGGFGAGGLVSTASDMAKWDRALNTERLLRRSSLEQLWTP
ncbi:MAG: serine hydrolase, partial [Chthoniobacterales bacterium]